MSEPINEVNRKIAELTDFIRVITNGINIMNDQEIKVPYIKPVGEFMALLEGIKVNASQQKQTLEATIPKVELVESKA